MITYNEALKKQYEKYCLQWMIDHDYSLTDLINELADRENYEENEMGNLLVLQDVFDLWEAHDGFNHEIWASYDEWLDNEGYEYFQEHKQIYAYGLLEGGSALTRICYFEDSCKKVQSVWLEQWCNGWLFYDDISKSYVANDSDTPLKDAAYLLFGEYLLDYLREVNTGTDFYESWNLNVRFDENLKEWHYVNRFGGDYRGDVVDGRIEKVLDAFRKIKD